MKFMIVKYLTIAIFLIPAVSHSADNCKNYKANTVLVDMGGPTALLGAASFTMNPMSGMGSPEPAGPKILYIFKKVSNKYRDSLKGMGITAKEGDVHIWEKYPDISTLKHLCSINPSTSNEKIKKMFLTK